MSFLTLWRKPLVQQSIRVAAIMGAGDVFAQKLVEGKQLSEVDFKRTMRFSSVGLFFVGPTLHIWYGKLEKLVHPNQSSLMRGLKKMAVDQLVFAPVFCAAILAVVGKLNGESNKDVSKRLKNDYTDIMLRNYMLWPAAQVINFSLVPLSYQVLFAQMVAVVWNTYLSTKLKPNFKQAC